MLKEFVEEYVVPLFVAVAVLAAIVALAWLTGDTTPSARGSEITHTTINRAPLMEMEDSGDGELAHIRFGNSIGNMTGWNDLSMDEQAIRVKYAGLFIETIGKATPKNPITGGFWHSFLRQMGVQMQIQAMYHLDELSTDPRISALQGFLVGL